MNVLFVAALTAVVSGIARITAGVTFDYSTPLLFSAGLLGCAYFWSTFRERLVNLAALVTFSAAFTALTYSLATAPFPFADDLLRKADNLIGFDAARFVAECPEVWRGFFQVVYYSIIPVTVLVLLVGDTRFVGHFMVCALITAAIFFFVPALGSCGINAPLHYQSTVSDLIKLKSGALTSVSWSNANGIITCPSFHVIWALLLFIYWPNPFTALFAFLTIPAAVVIGQHYLVDCVAGIVIVGLTYANYPVRYQYSDGPGASSYKRGLPHHPNRTPAYI